MKKLLLAITLLVACGAAPARAVDDARIGKTEFHSVVQLQDMTGRTFCSGVIVNRVVLTAWHCVSDGERTFVETIDGRWEAALSDSDKVADLAVLLPVDGRKLPKGVKVARKAPGFGDGVWVLGHALGQYTNTLTRGIVSYPLRANGIYGGDWMQHDAGQIGGNSGGPVYNRKGRLVAIASFSIIHNIYCVVGCAGAYQDTHIHGAVHTSHVKQILAGK